jgi:hypothetical protein
MVKFPFKSESLIVNDGRSAERAEAGFGLSGLPQHA